LAQSRPALNSQRPAPRIAKKFFFTSAAFSEPVAITAIKAIPRQPFAPLHNQRRHDAGVESFHFHDRFVGFDIGDLLARN
jgi:hypothetical protein